MLSSNSAISFAYIARKMDKLSKSAVKDLKTKVWCELSGMMKNTLVATPKKATPTRVRGIMRKGGRGEGERGRCTSIMRNRAFCRDKQKDEADGTLIASAIDVGNRFNLRRRTYGQACVRERAYASVRARSFVQAVHRGWTWSRHIIRNRSHDRALYDTYWQTSRSRVCRKSSAEKRLQKRREGELP